MGTRYSPSRTHPHPTTPGTPSHGGPGILRVPHGQSREHKVAVGLISVDQLSLYAQISGFQGMTEGYNLVTAGNPNDH